MRVQYCLCIALSAHLSTAFALPKQNENLERRQDGGGDGDIPTGAVSEGATPTDALSSMASGLLGGTGSIAGMLSGYSIASMFVTMLNCKFHVKNRIEGTE